MNLVLLEPADFIAHDRVVIKGRRFKHLKTVNRFNEQDCLACGLIGGSVGTGKIIRMLTDSLEMQVCLDQDPPEPLPLTLVLALPRPKMLKRIIEAVTSLGVKNIYLFNSWRVEKSFWQSPLLEPSTLRQHMLLGMEQSRDTILPTIHQRRFFTPFVNDELPQIAENTLCITAHPKTEQRCPSAVDTPVTLVIGPEGGLIDIEVATLERQGFGSYHIGQRILKVETAVTYIISRLTT